MLPVLVDNYACGNHGKYFYLVGTLCKRKRKKKILRKCIHNMVSVLVMTKPDHKPDDDSFGLLRDISQGNLGDINYINILTQIDKCH